MGNAGNAVGFLYRPAAVLIDHMPAFSACLSPANTSCLKA